MAERWAWKRRKHHLCISINQVRTMNKLSIIVFTLIIVGGCVPSRVRIKEDNSMKALTIKWQRLVDENGQTCQRCGATGKEVQKAFHSLKQSLAPLGIKVLLEKKALDPATCAKDISQSNRIWVGERPLEEWLDAQVGQSPCATCCAELGSDVECRTVKVQGQTYETIPADLIIKAGLLAASRLITTGSNEPYCEGKTPTKIPSSSCCPKSDSDSKECK